MDNGQWTMKKTQKPMVINDLQTFLDFQNVVKLLLTCLITNLQGLKKVKRYKKVGV